MIEFIFGCGLGVAVGVAIGVIVGHHSTDGAAAVRALNEVKDWFESSSDEALDIREAPDWLRRYRTATKHHRPGGG